MRTLQRKLEAVNWKMLHRWPSTALDARCPDGRWKVVLARQVTGTCVAAMEPERPGQQDRSNRRWHGGSAGHLRPGGRGYDVSGRRGRAFGTRQVSVADSRGLGG